MYESFYGLKGRPFSLLPDAEFLFLSRRHRRAVNMLEHGILSQAGFIVITGDVGAGKTTIVRRFIKSAGPDVMVGVVSNPSKSLGRLMGWIASAFGFDIAGQEPEKIYDSFVQFLVSLYAKGKRAVLVIDEAQNLTEGMLEDLRMLSNVNNEKDQLLQIVLVGQPELLEMLNRQELRQFAQRIAVHCHLDPLNANETAAYIRHRLSVVGGKPAIFNDTTCAAVYFFTYGVPRLINLLCDQALVYGFSEDMALIDSEIVTEVVLDRARSGLSAFRVLPEGWKPKDLPKNIKNIIHEIQKAGEDSEL